MLHSPTFCPVCNEKIASNQNDAVHRCINEFCSAKIKGSIEHFVSKNCMNIEGLGKKIIEILVENNLINNYSDIFYLKKNDLIKLERMAEVSVNNLLESIEQSKKTTFSRFINGLGIRNIGQNAAKILEKYSYGSIQYLMNVNEEDLVNINEVGLIMAKS